jgi:hypothetical protein
MLTGHGRVYNHRRTPNVGLSESWVGRLVHCRALADGSVLLTLQVSGGASGPTPAELQLFVASTGRKMVSAKYQLEHDELQQVFTLWGEVLPLTRRLYCLLRFLIENQRQLLSPAQLLDGVWEHALTTDTAALQTAMYRLRKRLGSAAQMIVTVRGGGYRCLP